MRLFKRRRAYMISDKILIYLEEIPEKFCTVYNIMGCVTSIKKLPKKANEFDVYAIRPESVEYDVMYYIYIGGVWFRTKYKE